MFRHFKLLTYILMITSCGTFVGNPKKPSDGSTPPKQMIAFPKLELDLPSNMTAADLHLTEDSSNRLLNSAAKRMDRQVRYNNNVLRRLESDAVTESGDFSGKGPDGLTSGRIEVDETATFKYRALICYNNERTLQISWNDASTKIEVVRSFAKDLLGENNGSNFMSHFTIDRTDPLKQKFRLFTNGQPWDKPLGVTDGDLLAEAMSMERAESGSHSLRLVADWYATAPADNVYQGDVYVSGVAYSTGSGEYVAYRKFSLLACPTNTLFNEANFSSPGWCIGQGIRGVGFYTDAEIAAAWTRVSNIGIEPKSSLTSINFDDTLSCP